jgi:phosphoribosylaminoimidazolecarboxamide formyltransferase/IMP cyclohydrolase
MAAHAGATSLELRKALAAKAYARTAAYDAAIGGWFAGELGERAPAWRAIGGRLAQELRYGENPHQWAAFYLTGEPRPGVATAVQHQGKELSYNNLGDTDAALELVAEFDPKISPAVAIIKHANPCGVALGKTLSEAYAKAFRCDPVSPFGGIIALNAPIDAETARAITAILTEVVVAPDATAEAKAIFASKKNLRLLTTGSLPDPRSPGLTFRSLAGGFLVQSRDTAVVADLKLKVVTKRHPTEQELADLEFAFKVAKHVKSNAIVYAKDGATVGIGAGQMSRVDSARIAALKSRDAAKAAGASRAAHQKGSVVASDAFFPFADGLLATAGNRRHGGDPSPAAPARRRGHRRRRRRRPRHSLHRHPPLPALTSGGSDPAGLTLACDVRVKRQQSTDGDDRLARAARVPLPLAGRGRVG